MAALAAIAVPTSVSKTEFDYFNEKDLIQDSQFPIFISKMKEINSTELEYTNPIEDEHSSMEVQQSNGTQTTNVKITDNYLASTHRSVLISFVYLLQCWFHSSLIKYHIIQTHII